MPEPRGHRSLHPRAERKAAEDGPKAALPIPQDGLAAEILGVHLEGPFISPVRRGVHPTEALARPPSKCLQKLVAAADGLVKILTVAPELPGALELIAAAVEAKVVAAIGHTDATYEQARAAIQAGARHAVHIYNAMRPFTHRDPGVIGAILTDPEVTAEVIADGVHVAGPAIQVLMGAKGFDTVLLASDGIAATGMPDGNYRLGNFEVNVKDGVARNAEGKLAGSTLTLDRALRNVVGLGVPLVARCECSRASGAAPRRSGQEGHHRRGRRRRSRRAHARLRVAGVMTRGAGMELIASTFRDYAQQKGVRHPERSEGSLFIGDAFTPRGILRRKMRASE